MRSELKLRILSGIVMAAVTLAATWSGGLAFRVLSVLIGLLVFYEWTTITGLATRDRIGTFLGWAAMALASVAILTGADRIAGGVIGIAVLSTALASLVLPNGSRWLAGGLAYAGLASLSLAVIRGDDAAGLIAMVFVFAVVWSTDILAFFVGRAIGGPKLAPRISPGKTWSGAIGGAIAAVAIATLVVGSVVPLDGIRLPLVALVLSVLSQCGDLFESHIKRRFGVKDSGRLIPGHGGVMDRADGLIFACVAALFLVLLVTMTGGATGASAGALLLGL
ncbi:phosphatidate cytidylyltransferase [Ensifer soli]|uniref:phosphatidate cytidylyltransferase n=1 Tax=Ciceribacter sp. sgz301302 TaxID=3342379 RepID=UPI0035B7481F